MLTKTERRKVRQALFRAIDYEESLIDAHTIQWRAHGVAKMVPKEYRPLVARCKRLIAAWRKINTKLAVVDGRAKP